MFFNGFAAGAIALLMTGAKLASAHMEIEEPAPFRSKFNPHATNIDYTNTAPLAANGANFPCKGYHSDIGTAAGAPTASYRPGGSYQFKVTGGAPHNGGSCQVSLSYDGGKTFTVIQSIIGGCPLASSYPFTIPADAPEGDAIWAWTWINHTGNREFYMNCAAVTISKSAKREIDPPKTDKTEKRASVGFTSRPGLFVANLANVNGCTVSEGTDVIFPNPGPDVVNNGGSTGAPSGQCGSAGPAPNPGNGGGQAPTPTEQAPVVSPTPTAAPTTTKAPVSLPGGVFITVPNPNKPVTTSTAVDVPAPAPTTLIVSTRPASNPTTAPAPVPTGGAGSQLGYPAGKACENEGSWNCLGDSFQRCASGAWSPVMAMAPGTKCQKGEGPELALVKRAARRSFRWRQGSKLQLA